MSSAWLLPEHIADVLPVEARRIEELRRSLLDRAQAYGYELIAPPMLEHLESLLSGTGRELDLRSFKLVDQLSGRTLGLRADTTIQAARIDAHLLNREGVTRLCYCGPVLHTRPSGLYATREPLQFGAEIFGHADLEADLEVLDLAVDCLALAGVRSPVLDLADARILRGVLAGLPIEGEVLTSIVEALSRKDPAGLAERSARLPAPVREALGALLDLYGGPDVLSAARERLPGRVQVQEAITQLEWLGTHLQAAHASVRVGFDLSDMSGYAYYSGPRFAIFGDGATDTLARGGRYDEVGAAFGRNRPAAGFSLDLKALAAVGPAQASRAAILAPWGEDAGLREAVRHWRDRGETVIALMPGHEVDLASFHADRELVQVAGRWIVQARAPRID